MQLDIDTSSLVKAVQEADEKSTAVGSLDLEDALKIVELGLANESESEKNTND